MTIDKSIDNLISQLQNLKKLDLSNSKELDSEQIKSIHEVIKQTQKLTSTFQKELSPIQKRINRKRVEFLKLKGRDPKNLTKAQLIERNALLEKKLENFQKEGV